MSKTVNNPRRDAGKHSMEKSESTSVSAAAFEKFLKGTHFPLNKKKLVNYLKQNGATQEVLRISDRFSERDYISVADVAKEFSHVKKR